MDSNEKDKEIKRIIIYLARNLGIKVLAEGVEVLGYLEFSNHKMCAAVQGFYYDKPTPVYEIESIFREYKTWSKCNSQQNQEV